MKYFYIRLQLHSCVLSTLWIWHFNEIYLNKKIRINITVAYLPRPSPGDHIYRHWTVVFDPTLEVWSLFWCPSQDELDNIPPQQWTLLFWQEPQMLLCLLKKSVSMHIVKLKTLYFPIHLINPPKHCLFTHYLSFINKPDSRKPCLLSINSLQALSLSMF